MKNKLMAAGLIAAALTTSTQASFLDFIVAKFMENSYTSFHGEGVPKKVGELEVAKKYRQDFINEFGITSEVDELGIKKFFNNEFGLALLKKGNDDEAAFNTVLSQKNYDQLLEWRNGPQFIKVLKKYTKENGCIPKVLSVSHGWRSEGRDGEGHGLSGNKGINGIFASKEDLPKSLGRFGTRSLNEHMKEAIEDGDIKFCGSCVAQFYACNISADFAEVFAEVSGCQTVVATGQNSPYFQSSATPEDRQRVYEGAHYWKSAAGVWAESSSQAKKNGYDALGTWVRATPVKNQDGKVQKVVKENLGNQYISL